MKGKFVDAVKCWMKNNRPTKKKAKSLGMSQKEYTKEYLVLVQMKIESEERDIPVFSNHPKFSDQVRFCIEMLKKEKKKYQT